MARTFVVREVVLSDRLKPPPNSNHAEARMWIKICGIRDRETARRIADFDVNAIGLNFYGKSPRVVTIEDAVEISRFLPRRIERVGLFVNHSIDEIQSIAIECRLDVVQFHGDEPASELVKLQNRLPQIQLIRAFRMGPGGLNGIHDYFHECHQGQCRFTGFLIDAHVTGIYGGSGKTVSWEDLDREYNRTDWPRLILAGGLTPANVADAIRATKPWGVDVANGVESSAGVKDFKLVEQFVRDARNFDE